MQKQFLIPETGKFDIPVFIPLYKKKFFINDSLFFVQCSLFLALPFPQTFTTLTEIIFSEFAQPQSN